MFYLETQGLSLAVKYQHVGTDHPIWPLSLEMSRKAQGESGQDRP